MVALVVVFVLLLLGGGVAGAIALMNNGSPGSDAASTASPIDTGAATTATGGPTGTSGSPSPTTVAPTPRRLTKRDVGDKVRSLGYSADLSTFEATRPLNVVIGSQTVAGGNSDGSDARLQRAFVFTDTEFLGYDTSQPSRQIKVVATTKSYVVLEYGTFAADDPDCCPTGTARVRFNWDGKHFTPQDPSAIPPSDPTVDGSRR
jgi:hypothetical protein